MRCQVQRRWRRGGRRRPPSLSDRPATSQFGSSAPISNDRCGLKALQRRRGVELSAAGALGAQLCSGQGWPCPRRADSEARHPRGAAHHRRGVWQGAATAAAGAGAACELPQRVFASLQPQPAAVCLRCLPYRAAWARAQLPSTWRWRWRSGWACRCGAASGWAAGSGPSGHGRDPSTASLLGRGACQARGRGPSRSPGVACCARRWACWMQTCMGPPSHA